MKTNLNEFAVVGMDCHFPGAENYQKFWTNLVNKVSSIQEIPSDRWDWQAYYGDPTQSANRTNIKWGGFINDIDKFDPMFFGISPKEAASIDPQHRLFLMSAWKTIEDAGYNVEDLSGRKIGIYAGVSKNDYAELMRELGKDISPFISTGTVHSILSNRLSFLFDFHGRSESIDTACSSGLVALHNAMRDISNGECESAIVGGVNALLAPTMYLSHSKSGMLSIDGQCKTFDAEANGYVRAEGVGTLLIKPLQEAQKAGDYIHGVIKGSAVNHGGRANFLTSPTVEAQSKVIKMALANANVDPSTISYVEAHGTGTPMGDPIEINALKKAYASFNSDAKPNKKHHYCALSSVKTNIGHLESASGIAGIIKVLLALKHKTIPALQNFTRLNPYLDLSDSPFYVAENTIDWKPLTNDDNQYIPRRASVSSFGMGGVNAHVILEESPPQKSQQSQTIAGQQYFLPFSAKRKDLAPLLTRYISFIKSNINHEIGAELLQSIAYTLQIGRSQMPNRVVFVVSSIEELQDKLSSFINHKRDINLCFLGTATVKKGERPELIKVDQQQSLTALALSWVNGAKLDWSNHYTEGAKPKTIPLPSYQFQKKRCWFGDEKPQPKDDSQLTALETDKPRTNNRGLTEYNCRKTLNENDFFIQDHVVQGVKVLPGVAYLEFARSTFDLFQNTNNKRLIIKNAYWLLPVTVDSANTDLDIKISFANKNDSIEKNTHDSAAHYSLYRGKTLHGKGEFSWRDNKTLKNATVDIDGIKSKLHHRIDSATLYPQFNQSGLNYGESFRPIKYCLHNDEEILSRLEMPKVISAGSNEFVLHPSMMDGIFQTVVALTLLGQKYLDRQYVPFHLQSLEIYREIPQTCYVHAKVCDPKSQDLSQIKYDATLSDEKGRICIKVNGLSKKTLQLNNDSAAIKAKNSVASIRVKPQDNIRPKSSASSVENIYYRATYENQNRSSIEEPAGPTLVFANKHTDQSELVDRLGAAATLISVTAGDKFHIYSDVHIQINPLEVLDYERLMAQVKNTHASIASILYLWGLEADSFETSKNLGVYAILRLVKSLMLKRAYKKTKIVYCYSKTNIEFMPSHTMVAGFARTLIYENPNINLQTFTTDTQNPTTLIRQAAGELRYRSENKLHEVAYKGEQRQVRKVLPFSQDMLHETADSNSLFKHQGTYLISGAAGGLGFIFSQYLVKNYAAEIIMLGRSARNASIDEKITQLTNLGGKAQYYSVDITNADAISSVLSKVAAGQQKVQGVIHAAGIIEDAYIIRKKEDSFRRVIETKINGVNNLDAITSAQDLDFFMTFSSIASLMPNQGQADYASANSFLDNFSEYRNSLVKRNLRSGVTLAINWPLWANGGMRVTEEEENHLLSVFGMKPLETAKGLDIFEQSLKFSAKYALSRTLNQVFAIEGDKSKIAHCLGIDSFSNIQFLSMEAMPPTHTEKTVNSLQNNNSEILAIFAACFDIPLNKIDTSLNFSEFGVDSITFLKIVKTINDKYSTDLKPTVFFEVNNIDSFIAFINTRYSESLLSMPSKNIDTVHKHNRSLIDPESSNKHEMKFKRTFNVDEFYLKDHVVEGQYNMPGACYIEMARQAGDQLFGDGAVVKLLNNYWVSQLSSPKQDFDAFVNFNKKGDFYEYEVVSYTNDATKNLHAVGQIVRTEKKDRSVERHDLSAIRSRCVDIQTPEIVYKQIIAEGLHVGPTFMPMENIHLGNMEALSRLKLPASISDTVDDYILHPTTLTGVFQTALISNRYDKTNNSSRYIPISIDEIELFSRVPARCLVHSIASKKNANNAKLKKFDLVIYKEDGQICVRLKGFSIRALKETPKSASPVTGSIASADIAVDRSHREHTPDIAAATQSYIKQILSTPLGIDVEDLDENEAFEAYGINSVMIVELNKNFEDVFGPLSKTLFFEYSCVVELSEYFVENHQEVLFKLLKIEPLNQQTPADQPVSETAKETQLDTDIETASSYLTSSTNYIMELLSGPIGLPVDEMDSSEEFDAYGINSVMIVELNKLFENVFGPLSKTLFFEYRNIEELAEYFMENHSSVLQSEIGQNDNQVEEAVATVPSASKEKIDSPNMPAESRAQSIDTPTSDNINNEQDEYDIAIIGVDGRYPGAKNIDQFWELLKNGEDCITDLPSSHFDIKDCYDKNPENGKIYSKLGGFLDDVDKFDAAFFNISPREAELIDPQERLFLEVTWGALEDAGYTRKRLQSVSKREVGVFVGALWQPYQAIGAEHTLNGNPVAPSGLLYSIANRVSYYLNLSGPSLAIDTACSASLTAVHLACQSIRSGDCTMAIAGGVNLSLHSSKYLFLSQNKFLSTDGRCRSFGEGGDGYVPGEGVGAILLKPLHQAIKDGDQIHGVIKGSSINHGGKTHGYTVPNPNAQAELIQKTLSKANINPRSITYIEAHGTGTPLGDPIEITGLKKAFESGTKDKQFCAIGSVKSNIGHLEAAAGIAAITKTLLQMRHNKLVPSIHSESLNKNIDFADTPFVVQQKLSDWPKPNITGESNNSRRAGISSFGAGGANAHIILEQYDNSERLVNHSSMQARNEIVLLSAKSEDRLADMVKNLHHYLNQDIHAPNLQNLAYTSQIGREEMPVRISIVVNSIDDLKQKLAAIIEKNLKTKNVFYGNKNSPQDSINIFRGDEDITSAIGNWVEKGKYAKLANIWAAGFDVEWALLHRDTTAQCISMPVYPFAKDRYWLPEPSLDTDTDTDNVVGTGASTEKLHPLVHKNTSNLSLQRFNSVFSGDEFFLSHHLVGTSKVLPAVAYIEMFRAAAELSDDVLVPYALHELTWMKPILVSESAVKVQIELLAEDDEVLLSAKVVNDESSISHCEGRLTYREREQVLEEHANLPLVDMQEILSHLSESANSSEIYRILHSKGLNLQEGFQGLEWVKWSQHSALGKISLPHAIESEQRELYKTHPSLLDSALQVALIVLETGHKTADALYLPFSIEEVTLFESLPDTLYSVVTPCDNKSMTDCGYAIRSFDVDLLDQDGRILSRVKNISFKETNLSTGNIQSKNQSEKQSTHQQEPSIKYLSPKWVASPTSTTNPGNSKRSEKNRDLLVVTNTKSLADVFEKRLSNHPEFARVKVLIADQNPPTEKNGRLYWPATNNWNDVPEEILNECGSVGQILYLWDSSQQATSRSLIYATEVLLDNISRLDKLLLKSSHPLSQTLVNFIGKTAHCSPIDGAVSGLFNSLTTEYRKLDNKIISISDSAVEAPLWREAVLTELLEDRNKRNAHIRFLGTAEQPLREELRQNTIEAMIDETNNSELSAIKQGGNYLISGGMGGIGEILSRHLAKNYHATVILLGRSGFDQKVQTRLDELAALGGRALYCSVDIADEDALRKEIMQAKKVVGDIDGVIHAAGILDDNFLTNKSRESFFSVLRPKLHGSVNLDLVTANEPLDFFVTFSSLTSVYGNLGQTDYGAANGFMDAFIHRRAERGPQQSPGFSISINWPLWKNAGMGAEAENGDLAEMLDDAFGEPIDTSEGLLCFEKALLLGRNQVSIVKTVMSSAPKDTLSDRPLIPESSISAVDRAAANQDSATASKLDLSQIEERLYAGVLSLIAEKGKFDPKKIKPNDNFIELGLESVFLTSLARSINKQYSIKLSPAHFFEFTSIKSLTGFILEEYEKEIAEYYLSATPSDNVVRTEINSSNKTVDANNHWRKSHHRAQAKPQAAIKIRTSDHSYAVVGMDCLFPGASNLNEFWELLMNNQSAVSEIPKNRWDWQAYDGDPTQETNKTNIKWGGFVDDMDKFDAAFFNISPREATLMDPQQRILLQSVWKAVENAGYAPMDLAKKNKVGFFLGASTNDYYELMAGKDVEAYSSTGGVHSISANRVSYVYDFKGPSIPVDTACSSSLVALDMAIKSLESGQCDIAITGGVNALITPTLYIAFSKAGMLSPTGTISPLDKQANGYVRGEGVGILVLKKLDKAIADNDLIHAVVKGSSVNHGGKVSSLTVPNPKAQSELILEACDDANIDVSTLNFIEMHGTGTPLGDPIEINGLKSAFKQGKEIRENGFCGVSSVKGNIGHLEAAAGIAGVIKAILALKHRTLPAQCNFSELNPHIQLESSPFSVIEKTKPWLNLKDKNDQVIPRRAGVSSFGFGGANAHIILEEYVARPDTIPTPTPTPTPTEKTDTTAPHIIVLSAKTSESLVHVAEEFRRYVTELKCENVEIEQQLMQGIAYTLQVGRTHQALRLGIVAQSRDELCRKLSDFLVGKYSEKSIVLNQDDCSSKGYQEEFISLSNHSAQAKTLVRWVSGEHVDWLELYSDSLPKRMVMPSYPFIKQRYWLEDSPLSHSIENTEYDNADHANDVSSNGTGVIDNSLSEGGFEEDFEENFREKCIDYFKKVAATVLRSTPDKIDSQVSIEQYGMDSLMIIQVVNVLKKQFPAVNSSVLMKYRTIAALTDYFIETSRPNLEQVLSVVPTNGQSTVKNGHDLLGDIALDLSSGKFDFRSALQKIRENDKEIL